ncbi:ATP/GTP-binding protein [Kosakonia sp. MUSA4]|uniref:AAA family ATPase n=1 Tax=Kosakonia sp. MUSA4 TaxID=2067958 RepID=UPI00159725A8|nr:ATP-binding protein [Kosakonia sp. MUSA4]QJT80411.1 abortive phage infection protein [Kosakonia sp. MUSA4]
MKNKPWEGYEMFLSLSVDNFRSFKNPVKMTFTPTGSKEHNQSHIYESENGFKVLKTIGIYGANASGKSNVLWAFQALCWLIRNSGELKDGQKIPCYEPYRLASDTKDKPITLEAEFLLKGDVRFIYNVSYTQNEIVHESLDFYPSRAKANIFTRLQGESWEDIKFGNLYKGGVRKLPFFKNNSYLSKAGNNAATPQIIRDIFNFFEANMFFLGSNHTLSLSSEGSEDFNEVMESVSKILCYIDTGIKSVSYTQRDFKLPEYLEKNMPSDIKETIIKDNKDKYLFTHVGEGDIEEIFEEQDESDGTRKIFALMPVLLDAFKERTVFLLDELDNGLHSHIADVLIRLFNDKSINEVGSQLIFTTHNIHLMTPDKMRRDQIWFVEKNEGKSKLFSLDDFDKKKVTTNTPYNTWYDEGRFGGVPSISFSKIKSLILEINGASSIDDDLFGSLDEDKE